MMHKVPRFAAPLLMLSAPLIAYADTTTEGTAVTIGGIKGFIESIASTFLEASAIIVVIFIIYGGIKMVSSAGDPTKFGEGKKIVINAVIGGAVIFGVGVIVNTIADFSRDPNSVFEPGVQQIPIQNRNLNQLP